jgi:hypothetical protein
MKRRIVLLDTVLISVICTVNPLFGTIYFSDDFSSPSYDAAKWNLTTSGSSSFANESQTAKFTLAGGSAYLKSIPIDIGDWTTIDLTGQWKITSAKTPEYCIIIYDADDETNWVRVVYKSWDDILGSGGSKPSLWFRDSSKPSPYTTDIFYRTPPTVMTDFSIQLTNIGWTICEGTESWTYASTTLADAASLRIMIGGWDASSLSNQIVYFDNIEVSAIPEPATVMLLGLGGLALRKRK